MRLSQFHLHTSKETPAEAEIVSHKLMLKAGMIRKLAAGLYTWSPLGLRVLRKVERAVREEMNAAGAVEVLMPAVQPKELWEETGRWEKFGGQLLKMQDRKEAWYCYGPTHEEVITDFARNELSSYKQLPVNFYQIQTKFRDEIRPRFGVMRAREFLMKDAYSFHVTDEDLGREYRNMYDTYGRIFTRLGLKFRAVSADSGAIGGAVSHEFQVLADSGEDAIFFSDGSDYAANVELAEADRVRPAPRRGRVDAQGRHPAPEDLRGRRRADGHRARPHGEVGRASSVRTATATRRSCWRWCAATTSSTRSSCPSWPGWANTAWRPKRRSSNTSAASRASSVRLIAEAQGPRDRRPQRRGDGGLRRRRQRKGLPPGRRELGPRPARSPTRSPTSATWSRAIPRPTARARLQIARGIEVGHVFQLGRKYARGDEAERARRQRQGRRAGDGLLRHRRLADRALPRSNRTTTRTASSGRSRWRRGRRWCA